MSGTTREPGTPRGRVVVTENDEGLRIEMPVRRTTKSWVMGALLSLPLLYAVASVLVSIVGFGYLALRDGGATIAAFVLGVLLVAFRELPFAIIGLVGAYFIWGTDIATITPTGARLRRQVGRFGFTPRTLAYTEKEPLDIEATEDPRSRPIVRIKLRHHRGKRPWDSEFVFGDGPLSAEQAESLATQTAELLLPPRDDESEAAGDDADG